MAKTKKVTITLDDPVNVCKLDELVEYIATVFDDLELSYAIEYSEEDCPDEPTP